MKASNPPSAATLDALRQLLGPGGYLDAPADVAPFLVDHRHRYRGATPLVALPASTAQVASLVRFCAGQGLGLVPQGGNTSYCGAATPDPGGGEVVVSLRRMDRIRAVEPANDSITVEAGCGRCRSRRRRPTGCSRCRSGPRVPAPSAATSPPTPAVPRCCATG